MENQIYIQDLDLKSCPIGKMPSCNVTVIDGDGFAFIIGWKFNDQFSITPELVSQLNGRVDNFITSLLADSKAHYVIGILEAEVDYSLPDDEYVAGVNFRHKYAVTKTYKGKRPSKPDWYKLWGPLVQQRLVEKWGFQRVPPEVEADDMVASLVAKLRTYPNIHTVTCGNDKDLHQIEGTFVDYKKGESWFITSRDAVRSLYKQVLMGDATDNIPGLKGYGKGKAEAVVSSEKFNEKSGYMYTLREFVMALGEDKGIQSFHENYMLCKLRPDLPTGQYALIPFNPEESSQVLLMRELLGDAEVNAIIIENSLEATGLIENSDLFKVGK